jgi:hypothetical protein
MKKILFALVSSLAMFAPALAQSAPPASGPNAEIRERFQQMRPVFDLMGNVMLMLDLDKEKGLAFTKAQAQKLLPVLKDLRSRADLKPADAEKILANIEDKILTEKQLSWMDDTQLKRAEERRKRFEASGGVAGQMAQGGGRTGGPGGGAMFQAVMSGKPFNPFKDAEMGKPCADLIKLLEKR